MPASQRFNNVAMLAGNPRFAGAGSAFAAMLEALVARARDPWRLAALYAVQAITAVLLLAVLIPPFEQPDEFNHAKRAEQVGSGHLVATRYAGPATSGGKVDQGIDRIDHIIGIVRFHAERKVGLAMLRDAGAITWGDRARLTFANTAPYGPVFYLPAAAAIDAGKWFHLSIVRTLDLARAATGLASVATATAAIGLAGEAAMLLFVLLSLPMSLSLFAAVSQDGPMLATASLTAALLVRLGNESATFRPVHIGLLAFGLTAIGVGRPAYICFAILPLAVPRLRVRTRLAIIASVLAAVAAWSVLASLVTMINTEGHRGVHPAAQLMSLLRHPELGLQLLYRAVTDKQGMEGLSFAKEFVGVLGWQDVVLPAWFYDLAGLAIAGGVLTCMADAQAKSAAAGRTLAALAIAGSVALVFLLEYMTWTPVGLPWVVGVQGRYFLPIAVFLPCALPALRLRALTSVSGILRCGLAGFLLVSTIVSVVSVVRRYYV